ncbi:MAG TPA: hypothetical protein VJ890_20980 [Vineibacter sp.]|nr:hypothetical protein [Vineibacter sp.]
MLLAGLAATPAVAGDRRGTPAAEPAPFVIGASRDVRAAGAVLVLVLAARRASQAGTPATIAATPKDR